MKYKPPSPDKLVGALQDVVHKDKGVARAAKSHKYVKDHFGNTCVGLDKSNLVWNVYIFTKFKDYNDWMVEVQTKTFEEADKIADELAIKNNAKYIGFIKD